MPDRIILVEYESGGFPPCRLIGRPAERLEGRNTRAWGGGIAGTRFDISDPDFVEQRLEIPLDGTACTEITIRVIEGLQNSCRIRTGHPFRRARGLEWWSRIFLPGSQEIQIGLDIRR
ncbi:MAG: hypothetical protein ACYTFG_13560 [Planctomycetota bacterium]